MNQIEYKLCTQCRKNKIPTSSRYHKTCKPCWKANFDKLCSDENDCVACRDCGMANVPRQHARLKPVCIQCYKTKMVVMNHDVRNGYFQAEAYDQWCEEQAQEAGRPWPPPPTERLKRPVYKAFAAAAGAS